MISRVGMYVVIGRLLMASAVVFCAVLVLQLMAEQLDVRVTRSAEYLVIASTPQIALPALPPIPSPTLTLLPTDLPTPTALPTFTPTPTPEPQAPIRVQIPKIEVNSNIVTVVPARLSDATGAVHWQWWVPRYAVGYQEGSGYPSAGTNIVLNGHNNAMGEVFRDLSDVELGDEVILYTADYEYHYEVFEKHLVPYLSDPDQGEWQMQMYMAATEEERLTIYSCYPYVTNANRIVVIARPVTHKKAQ